jgi:L-ascorbate metabolism protein UlaG (beta-lactamase superfamily)
MPAPAKESTLDLGDSLDSSLGPIRILPVNHASLVIGFGDEVLYVDPVGPPERYAHIPRPTAILVTHEHGDHFDPETLGGLIGGRAVPILSSPIAREKMPPELQALTKTLRNGESGSIAGIAVEARPAYNYSHGATQFHPKGNGNGYLLTLGGRRIYVSGDTEDTPELLALRDIDLMFLPMSRPHTMTLAQAANVLNTVRPGVAYPYHYKGTDTAALLPLVTSKGTEVRLRDWYAE